MRRVGCRNRRVVVAAALLAIAAAVAGAASVRASASWQVVSSMPTARGGLAVTRGADGRLYAIGGKTGGVATSAVEAYSPSGDTWSSVASLPLARTRLAAAHDGNLVYAMGGSVASGVSGELDAYDPGTNTWMVRTSMPTPRKSLAAAAAGGNVYAIGGENIVSNLPHYLDTVEEYIPGSDAWTTVASLPNPRSGLAAALGSDGRIYAIGGYDPNCACTTDVTAYSPISNTWTTVASLPTGRRFLDAVTGADGLIYAVGGLTDSSTDTTEVDVYDPSTNSWSTGPSLNTARDSLGVARDLDGAIYAVGGFATGPETDATERLATDFVPPSGTVSINGGATYTNSASVSVDVSASDTGSGVAVVRLSNSSATSAGLLTHSQDFGYTTPIAWDVTNATYGGTSADGVHTVYAQWEDNAGNWSAVSSDSIKLDTQPPTVQAPTEQIPMPATLGTSTIPLVTSWKDSDATSKVCSNTLRESVGGSPMGDVYTGTAKSRRRLLAPNLYRHEVVATDCAGNVSAPVDGQPFGLDVVPESSTDITYSGIWKTVSVASAYGGALAYTTKANASASFTITGLGIAWVSPTGPTRGTARVLIDGVDQPMVNLNTPKAKARQVVFTISWPTAGTHTITIVNQATAGHPRIDLDGLVTISTF